MKTTLILLVLALCGLSATAQPHAFDYHKDFKKVLAKTQNPRSELSYQKLLPRWQAADTTLTDYEVLALLIGFTDNPHFAHAGDLPLQRRMAAHFAAGEHAKTLALCDSFLAHVPVHAFALTQKWVACNNLGDEAGAARCKWQFNAIMDAMAASGDGRTPETGMFALTALDASILLDIYIGGTLDDIQYDKDANGNLIQVVTTTLTNSAGETVTGKLYFNIQHIEER